MTLHPRCIRTSTGIVIPREALSNRLAFFYTGSTPIPSTMDNEATWNEVDLRDGAHWNGNSPGLDDHEAIKAIRVDGEMIISHDVAAGIADLRIAFRAGEGVDGFNPGNYQLHAIEATAGAGVRQPATALIPLHNGKFEIYWERVHPSDPTFSAGFNFKICEVHY